MELISSRTVWLLTIFRAESTLRNTPLSHYRKLDVNPEYILRLSMGVDMAVVKYLPVRPISI